MPGKIVTLSKYYYITGWKLDSLATERLQYDILAMAPSIFPPYYKKGTLKSVKLYFASHLLS